MSGRTLEIRGVKKVEKLIQRPNAITHSYTMFPVLEAAGAIVLPMVVILYEPGGPPKNFEAQAAPYTNLKARFSYGFLTLT